MSNPKAPQDKIELKKLYDSTAAMIATKGFQNALQPAEVNTLLSLLELAFKPDSDTATALFAALELWLGHDLPPDLDTLIKETCLSMDVRSPSDIETLIAMINDFCSDVSSDI